jgi:hypothetical protein
LGVDQERVSVGTRWIHRSPTLSLPERSGPLRSSNVWIVVAANVSGVRRTDAADVEDNSRIPGFCEVSDSAWLCIKTARRQRLLTCRVGHSTVAEVPRAIDHNARATVSMGVRLNFGVCWNPEANRIRTRCCGVGCPRTRIRDTPPSSSSRVRPWYPSCPRVPDARPDCVLVGHDGVMQSPGAFQ